MGRPAKPRGVEVDVDGAPASAFALAESYPPFDGSWHTHAKHQILYAASGTAVLTVERLRWVLPPQRAGWIRAGTRHRVGSSTGIELRTAYVAPRLAPAVETAGCVFAVTPLAREMLLFATRWGPGGDPSLEDARTRRAFFVALAALAVEWMQTGPAVVLPTAETPELERAMAYVAANLTDVTVGSAARAAGTSVRTLSRRFDEEARMSFRAYVQQARIVRALELLALPRASVSRVGFEVGFSSPSAFASAFAARCGETPSAYAARVRGTPKGHRT